MNELLLIDLLSELDAELLQDNYIENDMKRESPSLFMRLVKWIKYLGHIEDSTYYNEETTITKDLETKEKEWDVSKDSYQETQSENNQSRGFSISVFKKKISMLVKVIYGIAATLVLIIGIIIVLIKRSKHGLSLKKIQISF